MEDATNVGNALLRRLGNPIEELGVTGAEQGSTERLSCKNGTVALHRREQWEVL